MMNVGIIGVGGVGGYFGGKMCRVAGKNDTNVFFVARGAHLDQIRKKGLHISTATEGDWICHPTMATDHIEDLPILDICFLCVKSYDLKNVVVQLQAKTSSSTIILPLLNGIDICERIRQDLQTAQILPACAYVGTHIENYGKVTQNGGACKILFGQDPHVHESIPNQVFDLFNASGITHEWFDDVYSEIWGKYIFISAFGLVTAGFDKTVGQVMESRTLSHYVVAVMNEIVQLSRKTGVVLPETIIIDSYQKGRNFPYETKTSFQRDIELINKPDERDLFGGTILRLGKRFNVDVPATRELWDLLGHRKPLADERLNG